MNSHAPCSCGDVDCEQSRSMFLGMLTVNSHAPCSWERGMLTVNSRAPYSCGMLTVNSHAPCSWGC